MGVKRTDVKEKVFEIIKESFWAGEVKLTDDLKNDLSMDSLDGVELMMCIKNKFGIEIPNEDAEEIKTVNDIVEYLEKKGDI